MPAKYYIDKQYTIGGFTGSLYQVCKHFGKNYGLVYNRMRTLGWDLETALTVQRNVHSDSEAVDRFECDDGKWRSLPQIAKHYNVEYGTLLNRLNKRYKSKNIEFTSAIVMFEVYSLLEDAKTKAQRATKRNRVLVELTTPAIDTSDPLYALCKEHHRDYLVISKRIKDGFEFEEAIMIPLDVVNIRRLVYKDEVNSLQYFCKKYKKDFTKCYKMLSMCYDFDYIMESKETNANRDLFL